MIGQNANSPVFSVVGQVKRPGRYDLRDNVRVADAIERAGGFRDSADQERIAIVRGTQRHIFNYRDFLLGKNIEDNLLLEDGDVVYVR